MVGPIVLACDEAYAMPLATTLRSLTEANRAWWPLDIVVLAFAFSEATRTRVAASLPKGSAEINWVAVDLERFSGFSTLEHVSKVTYARFLIARVLPETTERALYLDADLIVLNDFGGLWETDLDGAAVGAVLDGLDPQLKEDVPALHLVPRVQNYFNAGVLLIDLQKWRAEDISERALDYLAQHPDTLFSDQDALNVACDGKWKQLDPRWNFVDFFERVEIATLGAERRPWIVHFAAWDKPWNAKVPNINADFYDGFRSRTRFARTPLARQRDALQANWTRSKRVLKQYAPVRALLGQIR
ncbi:MAG TPA: glycosyltransferase family 8 protein [Arsenicitalea sp.]|jgi:lipopolysaccharide biosynthesis glycosyltransferase|nr:glycosyltransferase family 8 protein [Arsenicitalea sp.]